MGLATNIVRRGAIYYIRAAVPCRLVDRVGRRELWRSLRTSDPGTARKRAAGEIDNLWHLFDRIDHDMTLTRDDIDELVRRFYAREIAIDEHERRPSVPFPAGTTDVRLDMLRKFEAEIIDHLARGEFALVRDFADEIIAPEAVDRQVHVYDCTPLAEEPPPAPIDRTSPAYRELCQKLLRARLEAVRRQIERHQGNWAGKPTDPLFAAPVAPQAPSMAPTPATANPIIPASANTNTTIPALPPLRKLIDAFLAAKKRDGIAEKTLGEMQTALDWFVAYFGEGRPATSFTKKDIVLYRDDLLNLPAYWGDRCKGMTIKEACQFGATSDLPKLDRAALKGKRLGPVRQFWSWLSEREHDHFPVDPARDVSIKVQRSKRSKRDAFTIEQLNLMFRAPVFTGAASEARWKDPGPVLIRDHRYWAPLLALFSGCRRGEVCQLLTSDIVQREGVWCMSINESLDPEEEDTPDKTLKNEFSTRDVPIHPELHKLGFLTYVEGRRKAGKKRLFDVAPQRHYDAFGKWFGRFLDSLGMKSPRLVFHSFRHNFEQAMLEAIPDYALRWQLGGRTDDHSSADYRGKGFSITARAEAVAKITYPGLDLSQICP